MRRQSMTYSLWRRLDSHSTWSYFPLLSLGKHTPTPVPRASLSLNLCVAADRKISSPKCPALQQRKHFCVTDHYSEMPTRFSKKNLEVGVRTQIMTEHCSLACGHWLAQLAYPHQDSLSNSGTAYSGLDPLISIIDPENTPQASPQVNLMEVITPVRFSLPKKLVV